MKTFRHALFAVLGLQALFVPAAFGYSSVSYVRSGLIAQWDGIENAGVGLPHNASATTWVDLVGRRDLTLGSYTSFADGIALERLNTPSGDSRMAYYSEKVSEAKTIEVVLKRSTYAQYAVVFSSQGHATGLMAMKNSGIGSNFTGYRLAAEACYGENATLTLCLDSNALYQNGEVCADAGLSEGWSGGMSDALAIGGRAGSASNCFYGRIYAVRLYDRTLTVDEIAWNAEVDDFRFFGGDQGKCSLEVVGDPIGYGSPTPAYGTTNGLSVGDAFTCAVPSPVDIAGGTATCAGYLLETNAPLASDVWHTWRSGSENEFDYVHPDQRAVRLTWRWNVDAELGADAPTVVSVAPCDAAVRVAVTGFGSADSATLRVEYGTSASALDRHADWPTTLTQPCSCLFNLTGLVPNTAYFVRAVLTADGTDFVTAATPFVTAAIDERFLPQAYRTIECLASSGSQYVDTGVVGGGTTRCVADMMWTGSPNDNDYLGARSGSTRYYLIHCYQGWFIGYGDGYSGGSISANVRYSVESQLAPGEQWLKVNGATAISKTVSGQVETGCNLYLFAMNHGGNPSYASAARCYSLKIWKGDTAVRDYVPCLRRSDSTPGLYDYVNETFVTAGGTAFAAHDPYGRDVYAAEADDDEFVLTVSPASADSSLYVAYGGSYGGEDPADWETCVSRGTVAASVEAATNDVPTGWGTSVKVMRAFLVTGAVTNWAPTVVYQDAALPALSGVAVDGSEGDTLVVTGTLDYFPGDSCTLTVRVGDDAVTLDRVWTNLTGGVRTETGAFSFTLHKDDPSDPFYIRPGVTCYVCVEATSGDASARSAVVEVLPRGAAILSAARVTGTGRHNVSFTAHIDDLGMQDETAVSLWLGLADDPASFACVCGPETQVATGDFTMGYNVPELETTHYWQFRCVNQLSDGVHAVTSATAVATCYPKDNTVYTWKSGVTEGSWFDRSNWTCRDGDDSIGYPNADSSSAYFPANVKCRVTLDADAKMFSFNAVESGTDVVIASTNGATLSGSFNVGGGSKTIVSSLRFENVSFATGDARIGKGVAVTFAGGAFTASCRTMTVPTLGDINADVGAATLTLADGARLSGVRDLGLAGGGVITVRDATVNAGRILFNYKTGGGLMRIEGTNSVVYAEEAIRNASDSGYDAITNRFGGLVFSPPAGGYATAPVGCSCAIGPGAMTKMSVYADAGAGAFAADPWADVRLTSASVGPAYVEFHDFPSPPSVKSFFYWTKTGRTYERVQPTDTVARPLYGHFRGPRGMRFLVR